MSDIAAKPIATAFTDDTVTNRGDNPMPRISRIALCVICSALMAVVPAVAQASAPIEESETLRLRAHEKNISGYAGPKHTMRVLGGGKLYVAEVSGAISYYAKRQYIHPNRFWLSLIHI